MGGRLYAADPESTDETPAPNAVMMSLRPKLLAMFLLAFALQVSAVAYGQVTLTDNGVTVTLDNGIMSAIIQKNNGQITSMMFAGFQTVMGNIYYSMDGGSTYQTPGPCVFSVTSQSSDLIDLSFFQVYTRQPHVLDIDIHYVLRSGDSGVYTYAVLSHPASYAATGVGEWRQVWKLRGRFEALADAVLLRRHTRLPHFHRGDYQAQYRGPQRPVRWQIRIQRKLCGSRDVRPCQQRQQHRRVGGFWQP
jgi:hypothetical protein